jgi:hypothetical protein
MKYIIEGAEPMEYCPDPLLRVGTPQYLVIGESHILKVAASRLLDERIALEEKNAINQFIQDMLNGRKSRHNKKNDAARNYICILLIMLCCTQGGNENQSTWYHLRNLFTHELFDGMVGSAYSLQFQRSSKNSGSKNAGEIDQFLTAVQIFIAQILYRVAFIPFRNFTDCGNEGEDAVGRVPKAVVEDLIIILEKLLELLLHPEMFELEQTSKQSGYSFRKDYPDILNLLQYLIQCLKFLQVVDVAGTIPKNSASGAASDIDYLREVGAFFDNTIDDLMLNKNTVLQHCNTAIMATITELSRKGMRNTLDTLKDNLVHRIPGRPHYFAPKGRYHAAIPMATVVKESEFMLKVASCYAEGYDMEDMFRLARTHRDFSYKSLEQYCEKLYNRRPGSPQNAGSPALRVEVIKEMLSAAKNPPPNVSNFATKKKSHVNEFHAYVKDKLVQLAKEGTVLNKKVFEDILYYAERQGEEEFLRLHVYAPFLSDGAGAKTMCTARSWILQYHENMQQYGTGAASCFRNFAWDKAALLRYLQHQSADDLDEDKTLGESNPDNEPVLLVFCKLQTGNLTQRLVDQKEAALILQHMATKVADIALVARIQCLNTAVSLLQDQASTNDIKALETKLKTTITVAKIQLELERDEPMSRRLLPLRDVYRLTSKCKREPFKPYEGPFAKLRLIAAEGRQNPKVDQIWDELLATAASTGESDEKFLFAKWAQKLCHNSPWPYNVFRLDKIITWIVHQAQLKTGRKGAEYLTNTIQALINKDTKVQWADVWKQAKQRQFDPEYKYFILHFIYEWVEEHRTGHSSCGFKKHAIDVKAYLRNCNNDNQEQLGLTDDEVVKLSKSLRAT